MPYDAILFDFDGVLADSEPIHYACWAEIVKSWGVELAWDFYTRECIGHAGADFLHILGALADPPIPVEELRAQYPRKRAMFLERMLASPPTPEPVIRLIHSLAEYKLAVVTSTNRMAVEPVLEHLGIRSCFQAFVGGGDVATVKPSPEPYLTAARLLGAKNPLVVEDSDAGCASAQAAGFDLVRVANAAETASCVRKALGLPAEEPQL